MRRFIALTALALATSGCATYSWYRADTPADAVARDQAACYDVARQSAWDVGFSAFPRLYGPVRPWPWPSAGYDANWSPAGDPLARLAVEQRLHDDCMRSRGYELQRAPKA